MWHAVLLQSHMVRTEVSPLDHELLILNLKFSSQIFTYQKLRESERERQENMHTLLKVLKC